jgi:hypothetical protein
MRRDLPLHKRPCSGVAGDGRPPPSFIVRLTGACRKSRELAALDEALAAGADPWSDPRLTERAGQLCSLSERRKLAASLETLVSLAEYPPQRPRLHFDEYAVLMHRDTLLALARRLRDVEPVEVPVLARLGRIAWTAEIPGYGEPPDELQMQELLAGCTHVLDTADQHG